MKKTANKASSTETNLADSEASSQREGERSGASELERNGQFPVVGIGASAGSLEAFRKLLEHLPAGTGIAIVLVQPIDDTHANIQLDLLSLSTGMQVTEVIDGMVVRPDHIYVIQSQSKLAIAEGVLHIVPREWTHGRHRPIDYFLRTLARDLRHRAIGVILSGTGPDGALGLEAIKIAGGITFAQDAGSAEFDSMPSSAIAAGQVDLVLPPEGIAQELAWFSRHPYITPLRTEAQTAGRHSVRKILSLLQKAKGIDFTYYKANTLRRRIGRRIVLNKMESIADYAQFLRAQSAEVEALYQDILINVTSFFRNPETFVVLKERIFPLIAKRRAPDATIRIWTPGCSTGEEAYSIAISFAEFAAEQAERISVQIFATDLNDRVLEKARTGFYSKEIAKDVSPERLRRFFTEAEGGYSVSQSIREMVVFARQNVLTDPPFSRLDLISCRNLLIYLEPVLQKQVLPTLHYSLKPAGILWLGMSETVGSTTGMFTRLDKKHRFYSKKTVPARLTVKAMSGDSAYQKVDTAQKVNYGIRVPNEHAVRKEADRVLLARYSPASVIINADMEILQFRGSASAYFEPTSGKATLHLLKMASESLMILLNSMIQQAKTDGAAVRKEGVRINSDGVSRIINLEVIPIKGRTASERCFLVAFEPASEQNPGQAANSTAAKTRRTTGKNSVRAKELDRLQQELATTREYIQSLVEQHQAANDELQSANREIQSRNEELQRVNKELETAREELESGNEKLATLNDELNNRNLELSVLHDNLNNLQSLVERHKAATDELKSANREIQSRNEELQGINKELEAAREELESGNEKQVTLNDELNNRNLELSVLNDDLNSLLGSINIPILMLGRDMRIRRFTPQAGRVLSLNAADVGGLLREIELKIGFPDLQELVSEVISTASVKEREVQDRDGRWYSMHIRPYGAPDNKVDGAVVVLIDIDDLKTFAEAIVKTIHEPLIVLDKNQRVRTANHAFYETFSLSPEETQNRLIYELSDRQWEIPKLRTLLEEILPRNNQLQNFEVEHEFENIGLRTMRLNARRLQQLNSGEPLNLLVIEDITEREQTKALRESEDRYRTLFRSVPVAVFVSDRNSIIQHFNQRAVELWGREPVSGVDHYSSIKFYLRDGTPLHGAQSPIAEVLRTGISANNVEISIERPDGSRIAVIASFAALKGAMGEIAGAVTTFEDITEIDRVREAVRESADRLRFMADSMPQKIFTARPNGELDYCNRQWMEFTGHSYEEIKNWGWTQFIHPDDIEENTRRWQHSLDTGEPFQIEHRFRRADGEYRWHLSRAHAMRDAKGKVLMWISSNTEIDDMKRAEEERNHLLACEQAARADAEDANRIKDEFLATVSHELRTPLNAMLGWVQILRAGQLNEIEVAQALEAVERNAKVQNQLIADLLDTSRIIMGKLRFEMRPVELFPVIEAALETVRPAAEAKGVKLILKLDPSVGMVLGDADRLQQIVWNLLANSIKYTPKGGHVETRLLSEEETVRIIVRDTGEGISPEFLPHVFARFQQADDATTRQHGGLGLGLAIVRHLVEAHGGQVSASSEGTGQGATFAVTLPLMASSISDFEPQNTDKTGQAAILAGLRVLVVDDSSDARALLRMALTHRGAEVRIGDSVRAALDILEQWRADVLVSDIGMPDEDGYDLIRQVRSLPVDRGGNIPAVALTGYASARDSARVLAAGYQMFVPKPIDLEELVGTIASVIEHDGVSTSK